MHFTGKTEAGLTQIADLESELSQLQSLNAKLEEDFLAAERAGSHMSISGNGHDPGDKSQPGFHGGCGCLVVAGRAKMHDASESYHSTHCLTATYACQHLIANFLQLCARGSLPGSMLTQLLPKSRLYEAAQTARAM